MQVRHFGVAAGAVAGIAAAGYLATQLVGNRSAVEPDAPGTEFLPKELIPPSPQAIVPEKEAVQGDPVRGPETPPVETAPTQGALPVPVGSVPTTATPSPNAPVAEEPGVTGTVPVQPEEEVPASTNPVEPTPTEPELPPGSVHERMQAFDGKTMLNAMQDVRYPSGLEETIRYAYYTFDGTTAERVGNVGLYDAYAAAWEVVRSRPSELTVMGVVRDIGGDYWIGQLRGHEDSNNLDHEQEVVRFHQLQQATPDLKAYAQPGYGDVFLPDDE